MLTGASPYSYVPFLQSLDKLLYRFEAMWPVILYPRCYIYSSDNYVTMIAALDAVDVLLHGKTQFCSGMNICPSIASLVSFMNG